MKSPLPFLNHCRMKMATVVVLELDRPASEIEVVKL